jgi:DNA repair protein RecN (Recombination protein N)
MLETLHIRNFALIDDLVIPWKAGLNVLTGETGVGKSIIVDAVSLLLGERAAGTFIREGAASADLEALFDISGCLHVKELLESMELDGSQDELLLRRVITAEGRSKCFLNGAVVTLGLLSKVGDLLVDMHGQHEHQSLMNPGKHLTLLDEFAGLGADEAFIRQGYQELKQRISVLERLIAREASRNQRVAELEEELDLLDKADLKEGEDEDIGLRRNVIANSEKIHRLASEAYDMLSGGEMHPQPLVHTWNDIMQALKEIAGIDRSLAESIAGYEELRFKFADLADTLQSYISRLEYEPAELDALERRLEVISKLKRRHGCESLQALLELRERMREEYNRLADSTGEKMRLERDIEQLREDVGKAAVVLSQKRSEAASRLEKKVQIQLRDLGMSRARFVVSIRQEQTPDGLVTYKDKHWKLWSTGVDMVEFLFSANVGESPKPLRAIASGGEISRIMLAIRAILAEADKVPVIIFDEIDVGVGASMGMPIAEKLSSVASSRQVICVTHLPQIAAMSDNHVVVDKLVKSGRTRTEVSFPTGTDRVREIARMLGGEATGDISLKHAQKLLATSRKVK